MPTKGCFHLRHHQLILQAVGHHPRKCGRGAEKPLNRLKMCVVSADSNSIFFYDWAYFVECWLSSYCNRLLPSIGARDALSRYIFTSMFSTKVESKFRVEWCFFVVADVEKGSNLSFVSRSAKICIQTIRDFPITVLTEKSDRAAASHPALPDPPCTLTHRRHRRGPPIPGVLSYSGRRG